jgi:hypothetical protein
VGRALPGGSGRRWLGHGAGQSSSETCRHGGGAGRRPMWLSDGKVFVVDEEDGGELAMGHPSRWLGLGSEPRSTASRGASGRWLVRFPRWL